MKLPYRTDLPGFTVRPGPKGNVVVEIDLEADPKKRDAVFQADLRKKYPSEVHWRRENKRDWTSAAGESYFPEFVENVARYVRVCPGLLEAPVARGWDFGFRTPACVWMQPNAAATRLWLLRELILKNIDTHSFRDLVLYLSGELAIDALRARPRAMEYVNALNKAIDEGKADPRMRPPWFETAYPPVRFIDFGGPEALQRRAAVETESELRCDAEILRARGVFLGVYYTTVKAREKVFRKLMLDLPDGHPGLLVDPIGCPELCKAFAGGMVFDKGTKDDPATNKPKKDGWFDNLYEGAGYAGVNLIPVDDTEPPPPPPASDHTIVQPWSRPEPLTSTEALEIKELLRPEW